MNNMRKLMETVEQLNEAYVEYRDPDGQFQIIYEPPRGYWAVGKNDCAQDISGETFDTLEDAIEHAEICLSVADDDFEYGIDEAFGDDPDPYDATRRAREATISLHELMDEGILDPRSVADACLRYMSEQEVEDMANDNSFFGDE